MRDSRGFLWLGTSEGLSRFDGYEFVNYRIPLGSPSVNDLVQVGKYEYWLATGGGLYRFEFSATPAASRFTLFKPGDGAASSLIYALAVDPRGGLWCGTAAGLYHFDGRSFGPVESGAKGGVRALLVDARGTLWCGTNHGLARRRSDGYFERFGGQQGFPDDVVYSLLMDATGHLWAGTEQGLCRLTAQPDPRRRAVERIYSPRDGLAGSEVLSLLQTLDGTLWAGTTRGLSEGRLRSNGTCASFRSYTEANGLSENVIEALADDGEGNLWLASDGGGVMRLERGGFRTFTEADGLSSRRIAALLIDRDGDLCAVSRVGDSPAIDRYANGRFTCIAPARRSGLRLGWAWNQIAIQDHLGDWWMASDHGLHRFARRWGRAKAVYTGRDGLSGDRVFRVFEDSRETIWVSTFGEGTSGLSRLERGQRTFRDCSRLPGLSTSPENLIGAFAEDRAGHVWMGSVRGGGLFRYREGSFKIFGEADGVPQCGVRGLYVDRRGRLWVATSRNGVVSAQDPTAEQPRFRIYTVDQGLSSNQVHCVTEDAFGRIYLGTGRGVDRLDLTKGSETPHVYRFSTADGLPPGELQIAERDADDAIWFGTAHGLARLVPESEHRSVAPPIMMQGLRIRGVPVPFPESHGKTAPLRLAPDQNQIQLDFVGATFAAGESLLYQYRLEGGGGEWSAPSKLRTVNYARLSPGSYRFIVRSMNWQGMLSTEPATADFVLLRPVWQRWWFLTCIASALVALAVTGYRYRVAHLLQVERIRTRIASDLHDDIGASISQVAIMSEVVSRRAAADREALNEIARTSRDLLQSMSEIVWAIDPSHDRMHDLIQRMRWFAGETLSGRGVSLHFSVAGEERELRLKVDTRRQVFLIFKESVNNIARHSQARHAVVALKADQNWLVLEVADDGCGFDAVQCGRHGLRNMAQRARTLGGVLEVSSCPGDGTRLVLRVPLGRYASWRRRLAFPHKYAGAPVTEAHKM
jgi:ligand-binding sensor domain-containing protein/two-component sensor histidine kinase